LREPLVNPPIVVLLLVLVAACVQSLGLPTLPVVFFVSEKS